MSSFWSRIVVAVAALPLVLGAVYLGHAWLLILALLVAAVSQHEFYRLARPLRPLAIAGYAATAAALVGASQGGVQWMVAGFLLTLPLAFLLKGVSETKQATAVSVGSTVLGAAWIAFGLGYVLLLREIPTYGRLIAFTVLLADFANNTLAYFAGRMIGRHRLAPTISPGKTWEGFFFGVAGAVFVTWISLYDKRHEFLSMWQALVLGLAIALAGALGDLFESSLKRDVQVKDTGRLLGGHGGMLDRIDSLLFASVAAFYVVAIFATV